LKRNKRLPQEQLDKLYNQDKLTIRQVADALGANFNHVRADLIFYGYLRSKGESISLSYKEGRKEHPTKGKERPQDVKDRISQKNSAYFSTDEGRSKASIAGKRASEVMTDDQKQNRREKAREQLLVTRTEGSALENYLGLELVKLGYKVEFHSKQVFGNDNAHIDLFLPDRKVCIELDGKFHHQKVFDDDTLEKKITSDNIKNALVTTSGFRMVRLKYSSKLRQAKQRLALELILNAINGSDEELIILEIK
jgi:very-short-patch-repair endonuclease